MGMIFYPSFSGDVTIADGTITDTTLATDAIDDNALAESAILEFLNTVFPADPVAGSLGDMLSKTDNNTYDRSTDSLEALADAVATVDGLIDQLYALKPKRSAQSDGTGVLMTGSEQTLYEYAGGSGLQQFFYGQLFSAQTDATAEFTIRVYNKMKSGGSYVQAYSVTDTTATNGFQVHIAPHGKDIPLDGTVAGNAPSLTTYGYKITIEQTAVGAGYKTIQTEFYDSIG